MPEYVELEPLETEDGADRAGPGMIAALLFEVADREIVAECVKRALDQRAPVFLVARPRVVAACAAHCGMVDEQSDELGLACAGRAIARRAARQVARKAEHGAFLVHDIVGVAHVDRALQRHGPRAQRAAHARLHLLERLHADAQLAAVGRVRGFELHGTDEAAAQIDVDFGHESREHRGDRVLNAFRRQRHVAGVVERERGAEFLGRDDLGQHIRHVLALLALERLHRDRRLAALREQHEVLAERSPAGIGSLVGHEPLGRDRAAWAADVGRPAQQRVRRQQRLVLLIQDRCNTRSQTIAQALIGGESGFVGVARHRWRELVDQLGDQLVFREIGQALRRGMARHEKRLRLHLPRDLRAHDQSQCAVAVLIVAHGVPLQLRDGVDRRGHGLHHVGLGARGVGAALVDDAHAARRRFLGDMVVRDERALARERRHDAPQIGLELAPARGVAHSAVHVLAEALGNA